MTASDLRSRLRDSNPRPTHYENVPHRVHPAHQIHRCTSAGSRCTSGDTRPHRLRPRRSPRGVPTARVGASWEVGVPAVGRNASTTGCLYADHRRAGPGRRPAGASSGRKSPGEHRYRARGHLLGSRRGPRSRRSAGTVSSRWRWRMSGWLPAHPGRERAPWPTSSCPCCGPSPPCWTRTRSTGASCRPRSRPPAVRTVNVRAPGTTNMSRCTNTRG